MKLWALWALAGTASALFPVIVPMSDNTNDTLLTWGPVTADISVLRFEGNARRTPTCRAYWESSTGTTRRLEERMETSREPRRVVQILLTLLVFKATRMSALAAQPAFSIAAVDLSAVGW